jgi:hypothetical protein
MDLPVLAVKYPDRPLSGCSLPLVSGRCCPCLPSCDGTGRGETLLTATNWRDDLPVALAPGITHPGFTTAARMANFQR